MDPLHLIARHYEPHSLAYEALVQHSRMVAAKCLSIAERVSHLGPDLAFLEEAAMLHDIGIFMTDQPSIGCFGDEEYICHGYLGRELLEKAGFPVHALVCERHVGAGISLLEIEDLGLHLPARDMLPLTIEEKIICYADKFFSKNGKGAPREKSAAAILAGLEPYGADKVERFRGWMQLFG